jgi:pantetheine-phosphate adenylyltransferase
LNVFVYPGSFDPVTNGHLDIIERASKICDKLIIAVLVNGSKVPLFTTEERVTLIKDLLIDYPNIEVTYFSGLLADFMEKAGARIIIKGLRAISDFEYELQMAHINKIQNAEIETLFMMAGINHSFISSSAVKELARVGGNIDDFVPDSVKEAVLSKFRKPGVK